jgi:four helix bundle protein
VKYQEWEGSVPQDIKSDSLWKVEAYRLALFATDLGWQDVTQLRGDARTKSLSDQLYRALGSVSANIAEGYSRGTGKDRAHFYEYALGSARESRDWYYKARYILSEAIVTHRFRVLTQIIKLLLVMAENQRGRTIKEETIEYNLDLDDV